MLKGVLERERNEAGAVYLDHIARAASQLEESGILRDTPQRGDVAADFGFVELSGSRSALSTLLRRGPVVVSFYRGEWCRFCRAEIQALLDAQPAMAELGASLVMISPEPPSQTLVDEVAHRPGTVLVRDKALGIALIYGLAYLVPETLRRFYMDRDLDLSQRLSSGSWLLPIPADFVIAADGIIALTHVDLDFTRRLDPADILDGLRKLRRDALTPASPPS